MAAGLQQGEHQRSEFMAHRQAGESARARSAPARRIAKDGLRASPPSQRRAILSAKRGDVRAATRAFRCDLALSSSEASELDRLGEAFEIGLQLGLDGVVEHGAGSGTNEQGKCRGNGPLARWPRAEGPGPRSGAGAELDLADEVERRARGSFAFLPLGRADFARVGGDVLRGLDLAQQFLGVAADAAGVISMIWIPPSGSMTKVPRSARPASSISTSKLREIARGRVADHRVLGSCLIVAEVSCQALWREMGVGGDGVDLDAELLELG